MSIEGNESGAEKIAQRIDPRLLEPGTILRHRSGSRVELRERKADGSGWWNTDGSGFVDWAITSGDWSVETLVYSGKRLAQVTLCEETGYLAVRGTCPLHGGDACLRQYMPAIEGGS